MTTLLGEPTESVSLSGDDAGMQTILSIAESAGATEELAEVLATTGNQIFDSYGTEDAPATFSQLVYMDGTLSKIRLIDCKDAVFVNDTDVCSGALKEVVQALYEASQKVLYESEYFYFPELGLRIYLDEDIERIVELVDGRTEAAMIAAEEYEAMEEEDLEEYFEDEDEEDEWQ